MKKTENDAMKTIKSPRNVDIPPAPQPSLAPLRLINTSDQGMFHVVLVQTVSLLSSHNSQ